jgi:hypothetical protein
VRGRTIDSDIEEVRNEVEAVRSPRLDEQSESMSFVYHVWSREGYETRLAHVVRCRGVRDCDR